MPNSLSDENSPHLTEWFNIFPLVLISTLIFDYIVISLHNNVHWNCLPSLFPFARPLIFVSFRASLAADQNLVRWVLGSEKSLGPKRLQLNRSARSNYWFGFGHQNVVSPNYRNWHLPAQHLSAGLCAFVFFPRSIYQCITNSHHEFSHSTYFAETRFGINYFGGRLASPPNMAHQQMLRAVADLLGRNRWGFLLIFHCIHL